MQQVNSGFPFNPLFAGLGHHLVVRCVLRGAVGGEVWVNDPQNPALGVVLVKNKLFLSGNPRTKYSRFRDWIEQYLLRQHHVVGRGGFAVLADENWRERLLQRMPENYKAEPHPRMYLEGDLAELATPATPNPTPLEGFELAEVTPKLVNKPDLGQREELLEEMQSERHSVEDFLEHSFGVCLLHNRNVAGWCLSEYNLDDRCEVGIATAEAFRQRGLATLQGQAFFALARRNGIRYIGWHCWASNQPSVKTALRLGLKPAKTYDFYWCSASESRQATSKLSV